MSYCDAHNDFMCPHNDYVCTDRQWVCVSLQWLCSSQNCIVFFLKDTVIFTMALFTIIMTIRNIHNDYVWPSQWVFVTSQWFTCFQNEAVHPHNDSLWSLSLPYSHNKIWLWLWLWQWLCLTSQWLMCPHNDFVCPHCDLCITVHDLLHLDEFLKQVKYNYNHKIILTSYVTKNDKSQFYSQC